MKKPLGDELLFGKLENGGHVSVDVADGKVTFAFTPTRVRGAPTEPLVPRFDPRRTEDTR